MSIAAAGNSAPVRRALVSPGLARAILAVVICAGLGAQLHLAFVHEINWDEFLHLSIVHEAARGELDRALQTAFAHAFGWVRWVADGEIDQIVAARLAMFGLMLGTVACVLAIGRHLLGLDAALLAAAAYVSFSFVVEHASSFRTDPLAAFLLMAALWLVITRPPDVVRTCIAATAIGLAGLVTIKSALYVPSISAVLLIGVACAGNRRAALLHALGLGALAGFVFFAGLALHKLSLAGTEPTIGGIGGAASKTLGERDFANAISAFVHAVRRNPVFWLLIAAGLGAAAACVVRSRGAARARWAVVLACGAMLGSLLVYAHSFPYFYPFMLAPAVVLAGAAPMLMPARVRPMVAAFAGIGLALSLVSGYRVALGQDTQAQRQTLEVVHRMFPEPTPYIDRCSMVSSYPKTGFFMSAWGMWDYYRQGVPVMRGILERDQPKFLLANRRMLELDDLGPEEHGPAAFGLFREDIETLRANFIRHWGAIYVAGKRVELAGGGGEAAFEIVIEGRYTLESPGPVTIDGVPLAPGESVLLARGQHRMAAPGESMTATLRWGESIYRPDEPAPRTPLFTGF